MKPFLRSCPADIPHGEHNWISEEGPVFRCPGQDTGDVSSIARKFCGNDKTHHGHLLERLGKLSWCPGIEQIEMDG